MLVCGFFTDGGDTLTSATDNGGGMTFVNKVTGLTNQYSYLYLSTAPATGSHTIAVNFSGSADLAGFCTSFTGTAQSGQPDSNATNTGASSPGTVTTTTVADNSVAVSIFRASGTWTASTNSTLVPNTNSGGQQASDYIGAFYTNFLKTPAGSLNMQATTGGTLWEAGIVSIAPFVASTAVSPKQEIISFDE